MADYRTVKVSMWAQDEWFMDLPIDGKLLWVYLFTNAHASVAGIYKLPMRTMAFETSLSLERVDELLRHFSDQGKALYQDGVIWVVKMREHQATTSPKVLSRVNADIDTIPDSELKRIYCKRYGIGKVSVGYPQSATETETDTDTETDTETETERETETQRATTKAVSNGTTTNDAGGNSSVDIYSFTVNVLSQIGFKDADKFLESVDLDLAAYWAWYYVCQPEKTRKTVQSWPALINKKVRADEKPRMSDEQQTAFRKQFSH